MKNYILSSRRGSLARGHNALLRAVGFGFVVSSCGGSDHQNAPNPAQRESVPTENVVSPAPTIQPLTPELQAKAVASIPLSFVQNQGQFAPHVRFSAQTADGTLAITDTGFMLAVPVGQLPLDPSTTNSSSAIEPQFRFVEVRFDHAISPSEISVEDQDPMLSNYYLGNDSTAWRTGVPSFRRVRLHNVYQGVDVVFYGNANRLEYDFVLAPGADPSKIALQINGADRLATTSTGAMEVHVADTSIELASPRSYQTIHSVRREVESKYQLDAATHTARFELGSYDPRAELVIDPLVQMATFHSGSGAEIAGRVKRDASGNIYLVGITTSTNFPTTAGSAQTTYGGSIDLFVTKFNSSMTARLYSTYVGGSGSDWLNPGGGMDLDASGNVYVSGTIGSTNFPTTPGAYQTTAAGMGDVCAVKIASSNGTLVYSSYLGGSGLDYGGPVAVDSTGALLVTGYTVSANFPVTAGAYDTTAPVTNPDIFVTRLNPTGSALEYSTFYGGPALDRPFGIVVDSARRAIIHGISAGAGIPVAGGGNPTYGGGATDSTLVILDSNGANLLYGGYFGGSADEPIPTAGGAGWPTGTIDLDAAENIYVTGYTNSANFPLVAPADSTREPMHDVFLMRLAPLAASVTYSSFVANTATNIASPRLFPQVEVSSTGTAYVSWLIQGSEIPLNFGGAPGYLAIARFNESGARDGVATLPSIGITTNPSVIALEPSGSLIVCGVPSATAASTPGVVQPAPMSTRLIDGLWMGRVVIDLNGAGGSALACTGDSGSSTANPCASAAPLCVTTGPAAGACVSNCNGDFGTGATGACPTSANPACYVSGGFAGMCRQCSATNASACTAPNVACNTSSATCSRCTGNFGTTTAAPCPTSGAPICLTPGASTGSCVACTMNSHCSGATPVCNTTNNTCIAVSVTLTNPPANGTATTTMPRPAITGTGVAGQTVTVTRAGGTAVCTATVSAGGTWTCTPTSDLAAGSNTIVATSGTATSTGTLVYGCTTNAHCAGATPVCNTATSTCVANAVALTNPPANGTSVTTLVRPVITGTGVPGQSVTVTRAGATAVCTATVAANGTWSCTPTADLARGSNAITATSGTATSMGTVIVGCTTNAHCAGATPVCNTATNTCVASTVALTNPPANGMATTTNTMPNITGTGVPGQMVAVTRAGMAVCTATVAASGMWSCMATLPIGSHAIVATSNGATSMGTLIVQCTMNAQCSGSTPRCLVAMGTCVQCLANPDCSGATPVCNLVTNVCGAAGDADGDTLSDALEMTLGTNPNNPDTDGDGLRDDVEVGTNTSMPRNTDMDTLIDARDPDDDNDTVPTMRELGTNTSMPRNTDMTDQPDYLDPDDDNDTIPTAVEVMLDTSANTDFDRDNLPSYLDTDADDDTILDSVEVGMTPSTPANSDGVMFPDFLDTDSDNDCLLDRNAQESGAARTNAMLPSALADNNCMSPRPVCDTTSGTCVVCLASGAVPHRGCMSNVLGQRCVTDPTNVNATVCGCTTSSDCVAGFTCSTTSMQCTPEMSDAGVDASSDAAMDASSDASSEASVEAGQDSGMEAAVDAGGDASLDAMGDQGTEPTPRSITGNGACACRVAGAPKSSSWPRGLSVAIASLAWMVSRRRARRLARSA